LKREGERLLPENRPELAKFERVKKMKGTYLTAETRSTASHEEIV
jgi:hypothetical protein